MVIGINISKTVTPSGRKTVSGSTSCRAVVLHYENQEPSGSDLDATTVKLGSSNSEENTTHNPILSFVYQKNKAYPYGEFIMELANDQNYSKLISPGDWIGIYLKNDIQSNDDNRAESLRCLGNVSRVQKRLSIASDGTKTTTWQVSGSDWGKFFHTIQIVINSQLAQDQYHNATVASQKNLLEGSSSELVSGFIEFFLKNRPSALAELGDIYKNVLQVPSGVSGFLSGGDFSIGGSGNNFYDILNFQITDNSAYERSLTLVLDTLQPFWTVLRMVSNSAVNELFLEMDDDEQPTVFMRPMPYALPDFGGGGGYNNQFLDLNNISFETSDLWEYSLGVSDVERKNYFFIRSEVIGTGLGVSVGSVPRSIDGSMERYGPGILWPKTTFVDHGIGGKEILDQWIELLEHWYGKNHMLENGTIVVNGKPGVRVGKRLDLYGLYNNSSVHKSYYIEGYVDQWQFPGVWQQSIMLSRGVVVNDGNVSYVYDFDTQENVKESRSVSQFKRNR